jgi:hypothetical protein
MQPVKHLRGKDILLHMQRLDGIQVSFSFGGVDANSNSEIQNNCLPISPLE